MEHAVSTAPVASENERIRQVGALQAFHWLRLGWSDLVGNPAPSISHGLILAAIGWLVLFLCSTQIELLALAISGFLLVGPIFGAGFYALSRLRAAGEKAEFDKSLDAAMKNIGSLTRLGVILGIIAVVWAFISRGLFLEAFHGELPATEINFYRTVVEWPHQAFFVTYMATGAVLAVIAFVISAVSAPMIFDRGGSTRHAIMISIKAVAKNPLAMAIWAALIVGLTAIGFATFMAGLVITLPLIGHATWHAYRDLVSG